MALTVLESRNRRGKINPVESLGKIFSLFSLRTRLNSKSHAQAIYVNTFALVLHEFLSLDYCIDFEWKQQHPPYKFKPSSKVSLGLIT